MRDVKFKFWYKEDKEIYYPENIEHINFEDKLISTEENGLFGFDEIELLQYTGLKDKNDKEIYEGDIVKCEESNITCKVIFQKSAMFMLEWKENDELQHYGLEAFTLEVIGNIYENPKLLEEACNE